ncbi:hypothetical protein D3C85_15710 [compost metagenome]
MPAFYRDCKIGFRNTPHFRDGLSLKMVNSGVEHYFTKYGFIYPLGGLGPSLPSIIEKRALFAPLFHTEVVGNYLVIDKHGELSQVDVYINDSATYTLDVHSLPKGIGVSWVLADREWTRDIMSAILMADLSDHDTIQQFHDQNLSDGSDFTVLTVDYVAVKLRDMFPE